MARNNKADIQEQVDAVFKKTESKNRRTETRVVKWVIDGVVKPPKYEKRDYFLDKEGVPKTGKCVGLSKEDLEFIVDNWDDIRLFFP